MTITTTCNHCNGTGFIPTTELFRGTRVQTGVPCHDCQETGQFARDIECTICMDECTVNGELCECCLIPESVSAPVVYAGGIVNAPGFTSETFAESLRRAQGRGYVHVSPIGGGKVFVDTAKSPARYAVSRHSCTCAGHVYRGTCLHRAACIWIHDVAGIDITREEVLGFDERGNPVTRRDRQSQIAS